MPAFPNQKLMVRKKTCIHLEIYARAGVVYSLSGINMIKALSYAVCISGFVWLGFGSLHFRQSLRTNLRQAYFEIDRVYPNNASDLGKFLNLYYESVYRSLPSTFWPATMLMVGSTVLLLHRRRKHSEVAPPNGGPALLFGGSVVSEGPPSVS